MNQELSNSVGKASPGIDLSAARGKRGFIKEFLKHKYLYLMVLPGFIIVLLFNYLPMYGILISFKDYNVTKGIMASPWVGFKHFEAFFNNPMALRLIKNTLTLGLLSLLWGFPAPIILALLFNEVKSSKFKRFAQSVSYFPHFISVVIVVGMIKAFCASDGLFNQITALFGLEPVPFLAHKEYFRTLFIGSGIWQGVGWGTILYLASLSGVDTALYDVASIDGANRWQKIVNISWPHMKATTVILLIFSVGGILGSDFQKIMLMYNPSLYEVADVIDTYVYREGIQGARFEYSTAIGLFMSGISFVLLYLTNMLSRKVNETSLW